MGVCCISSELYATETSVLPATQTSQKVQSEVMSRTVEQPQQQTTIQKAVSDVKQATTEGQLTTDNTKPSVAVEAAPSVVQEVKAPTEVAPTATPKVVEEVVKDVRITQPILEDKMQTFDQQMNIMGEATVGTAIKITVCYGGQQPLLTETREQEVYTLEKVGATGMFSQLIDLQEGENYVYVYYQYAGEQEIGKLSFTVTRIKESEKEIIKSYMDPQTIVENMLPQANTLRSDTTVN